MKFGGILGFDNGVMLAPMGVDVAGPELVAAVANAGGIGLITSPVSTTKPFGAGILLQFEFENSVRAIFDEKLACLQVGTAKAAERAIAAGVDCIVAQGSEAGGHVAGTVSLAAIVPRIVDAVGNRGISVVAAGSIVDARGYVAALALGAQGINVGTRFIATNEAYANDYYKQQILHYNEEQTDRTDLYERLTWKADVRCLLTPFHQQWRNAPYFVQNDKYQPIVAKSIFFTKEAVLRRFSGQVANPTTSTGNLEDMVSLVNDIVPAAEVVRRFVDGAKAI
ncbi:hypothetical protein MKW94_027549 [Papaver nudicaule]|uniref:Nitronate monooxygenase domain-containing protein n=1 Tax=Papaver nudicaule TaxID=74823 RepID=A0AA41RTE5_PAPNU|nr:hypothetical protein [Papaver nudicaule]